MRQVSVKTGTYPSTDPSKPLMYRPTLLSALALTFCAAASAAPPSEVLPAGPHAEQWRALSRFGYGPTLQEAPGTAGGVQGRAWAMDALAQAVQAAQRPPVIPPEYSGFEIALPSLIEQNRASQQERRDMRSARAAQDKLNAANHMNNAGRPAEANAMPMAMAPEKGPPQFSQQVASEAAQWRLWSCSHPDQEAPLLARMTEFWFNHFNVFVGKPSVRPFIGHYVVNAIRPHALGHFEDLLLATARHPAMLNYLDQVSSQAAVSPPSRAGNVANIANAANPINAVDAVDAAKAGKAPRGINENYAREVMELHTLGVGGGYTQADVQALARILTGWTIDPKSESGFRFTPRRHDTGTKVFLGQTFTNSGEQEGIRALHLLAMQPATARRISLRLAQWFVADEPPPAMVERLTQRYLDTQGDIRAVMQTLIESPETWAPDNQLFKTPMDYACSVLSVLGTGEHDAQMRQAEGFLRNAGQAVHGWITPDGYGTSAATWLSPEALTRRADFAVQAGRAVPVPGALAVWLPVQTWARIAREPERNQAGLALASPTWMRK